MICTQTTKKHRLAAQVVAYIEAQGGHTDETYQGDIAPMLGVPVRTLMRAIAHSRDCPHLPGIPYRGTGKATLIEPRKGEPTTRPDMETRERHILVGQAVRENTHKVEIERMALDRDQQAQERANDGDSMGAILFTRAAAEIRAYGHVTPATEAAIEAHLAA